LRQNAEWGGAHALTFVAALGNFAAYEGAVALASAWKRRGGGRLAGVPVGHGGQGWRKAAPLLGVALGMVAMATGYGWMRVRDLASAAASAGPGGLKPVAVAVIQAGVENSDKVLAERGDQRAAEGVLKRYFDLSDAALGGRVRPEIVVWPETAYPARFGTPRTDAERGLEYAVKAYARSRGVPIVFGAYDVEAGSGAEFNAMVFLRPDGTFKTYRKKILLPVAERIPFMGRESVLRERFPNFGFFGQGEGARVVPLELEGGKGAVSFAPVICYEALFASHARRALEEGARVIVNLTNDSWFGDFGEPENHLAMSVFRSIETRMPQIRATQTGISALILADGTIAARTRVGRAEVMLVAVPGAVAAGR
jgi:apolipoprotein N-acyltransferase